MKEMRPPVFIPRVKLLRLDHLQSPVYSSRLPQEESCCHAMLKNCGSKAGHEQPIQIELPSPVDAIMDLGGSLMVGGFLEDIF